MLSNLKYRLAREFDEMSTVKRIAYGVGLIAAITIAVLLLSGTWEPFAVHTGVTHLDNAKK